MTISTTSIRRIFVDSSAWINLINKKERHYADAVAFHKSLNPLTLRITSWGIVSETFTWLRYHIGYQEASRWLMLKESLEQQGFLQAVFPDAQMEVEVRKVIDRFQDQDISYIDAFTIALVRSRSDIDAVFAFDHHMAFAGLPVFPGPLN